MHEHEYDDPFAADPAPTAPAADVHHLEHLPSPTADVTDAGDAAQAGPRLTDVPAPRAADGPGGVWVPPSRAFLDGDALVVDRLVCGDPHVVAAARRHAVSRGPDALPEWALGVLAVGARAAALADGAGAADLLGSRIDALGRDLADAAADAAARIGAAADRAADPRSGTVRLAVDQALAALTADVGALVAGEDAPLRLAVARALERSTADAAGRVERALAANAEAVRAVLGGDAGPVARLTGEIARAAETTRRETTAQITQVRDLLAEARGRETEAARGTAKGATWEAMVVEQLTVIAAGTGHSDTVDATGTVDGAEGKTGDAVFRVGGGPGGPSVVVEAKASKLSTARWQDELTRAKRNRRAECGLGVVRGIDAMPGRRRVLVLDSTTLVVCWDPDAGDDASLLTACVLLLRTAAHAAALAGTGRDADLAAVADSLRAAVEVLAGFDALDRAATHARRSVEETLRVSGRLRTLLAEHLGRAGRLLAAPDAGAAP